MTRPARTIDVAALIDQRRLSPFNYRLIVLSWVLTFFDGLDMSMISYTAPYMRDDLNLTTAMLGNIFAAGTAGMMIGGLGCGLIADRIGRRPMVIVTSFAFGLLTMATAFAQTYPQLLALRFLDGLAIGGMFPIAWALNIEFVPTRLRAGIVAIVMLGFALGGVVAAPLTNWLGPIYGWQAVYIVGGASTIVGAAVVALGLPESVRFLTSRQVKLDLLVATLKRLEPSVDARVGDHFVLGDEPSVKPHFELRDLFTGKLKVITPMLWLAFFASSLAAYTLSNWIPSILEELEVPRNVAGLVAATGVLAGSLAGVVLMLAQSRLGLTFVAWIPALATVVSLVLGLGFVPQQFFLFVVVLQKTLVSTAHMAILSIAGTFYPSSIRASGGGWASAVAKIGAVVGPMATGLVLASGIPILRSFAIIAICPAILCTCLIVIGLTVKESDKRQTADQT